MKEYICDKCGKKVDEEGLYGEDYNIYEELEEIGCFSFGEVVYNGSEGELCGSCIKKLFIKEIQKYANSINQKRKE